MKKDFLKTMLFMLCAVFAFSACSDDDDKKGDDGTIVGGFVANEEVAYSNVNLNLGTPVEGASELNLQYEGSAVTGKTASFSTSDGKKAEIKLNGILPHEVSSVLTVDLQKGEDLYTFSGNSTSAAGTSFSYEGSATSSSMTLKLTNVKIPANDVTTHETWYTVQLDDNRATAADGDNLATVPYCFHLDMKTVDGAQGNMLSYLGSYAVSSIFSQLLKSVTFHENGIITAEYNANPSLEGVGEVAWTQSPEIPLATYFVDNDKMYVTPNIELIMNLVNAAKTKAAEGEGDGPTEEEIAQAMAVVMQYAQKWSTEGICLKIQAPGTGFDQNFMLGTPVQLQGDMELLLANDEVKPILEVLPVLSSVLLPMLPEDYREMVETFLPIIESATELNVGIVFRKNWEPVGFVAE